MKAQRVKRFIYSGFLTAGICVIISGLCVSCKPSAPKENEPVKPSNTVQPIQKETKSPSTSAGLNATKPKAQDLPKADSSNKETAKEIPAEDSGKSNGLLAFWRCDNPVEIKDLSGNGHTLKVNNGKDGKDVAITDGGGLGFSGDDSATTADSSLAKAIGNASCTLSCWFRTTNPSYAQMFCGWYHRKPSLYIFNLRLEGERGILFNIQDANNKEKNGGNNNIRGGKGLNDGKWHHVVGVRNFAKTLSLYIDGKFAGSTEDFGWPLPADMPFSLSGINPYQGDIDSVSVWSRALTENEVSELTKQGRVATPKLK